jgi:hypothetical protein
MSLVLRKETANITRYKMKPEYKNLLMAIQALPGVHVTSTVLDKSFDRIKKGWNGVLIFLHIEECTQEGLFFLTRCMDRRYWEHGNKWRIELEAGDNEHLNGDRPINYNLFRPFQEGDNEQIIIDECKSLFDNMMDHFNHDNFMTHFNMDRKEYHLVDEVAFDRRVKLENIGI